MRKKFLRTRIIVVCMVLTITLLSACSTSSPVGTWYDGDSSSFYNFDEGGNISYYQSDIDSLLYGEWVENDGFYEVSGFSSGPMICKQKNKNTLYCKDYDFTLKRGAEKDIPDITIEELIYESWFTADRRYQLNFYGSLNWYYYDNKKGEPIEESTYIIKDGFIVLITEDGTTYHPTIAENRHEMTVFDDMVFIAEQYLPENQDESVSTDVTSSPDSPDSAGDELSEETSVPEDEQAVLENEYKIIIDGENVSENMTLSIQDDDLYAEAASYFDALTYNGNPTLYCEYDNSEGVVGVYSWATDVMIIRLLVGTNISFGLIDNVNDIWEEFRLSANICVDSENNALIPVREMTEYLQLTGVLEATVEE